MEDSLTTDKRFCACGCGEIITIKDRWGRTKRFKRHHHNRRIGEEHIDGKYKTKKGYIEVYKPEHPNSHKWTGYIFEHRLVMEQHLGRYLTKEEVVHHINGNRSDNRIENLQLTDEYEHMVIHKTKDLTGRICLICGSDKTRANNNGKPHWYKHPITKQEFVCSKCYDNLR